MHQATAAVGDHEDVGGEARPEMVIRRVLAGHPLATVPAARRAVIAGATKQPNIELRSVLRTNAIERLSKVGEAFVEDIVQPSRGRAEARARAVLAVHWIRDAVHKVRPADSALSSPLVGTDKDRVLAALP